MAAAELADGGAAAVAELAIDVLPALSELRGTVLAGCLDEQPASIDDATTASTLTPATETFMVAHRPSVAECPTSR